jgi:hypothetical protein
MSAMTLGERTCSFFELVQEDGKRLPDLPFQDALERLAKRTPKKRQVIDAGRALIGTVLTYEDHNALRLVSTRDTTNPPELYAEDTGEVSDAKARKGLAWVETSLVVPAGFGNIVALMRNNNSSPAVTSLEDYLNGLPMFKTRKPLDARPVLSPNVAERIASGQAADQLVMKANAYASGRLDDSVGLGAMLDVAKSSYGDVDVEVRLTIPRGGKAKHETERDALFGEATYLHSLSGHSLVPKAQARVEVERNGRLQKDMINFVKDRITSKVKVDVTGGSKTGTGGSMRTMSALGAMIAAIEELEPQLRRAVANDLR